MSEQKYDVFFSYAHADAQTDEQKKILAVLKETIEQALEGVAGRESRVFLDSEALRWGDEWSARIRSCIDNARVFVYLLSPNYLKSNYCQREKMWWARREIRQGRLNKATRPIYYVELPETGDAVSDHYIQELTICQGVDKPFFASLDEVKSSVVACRLASIRQDVAEQFRRAQAAEASLCTVYPAISKFFVGRLKELADLNQLCREEGAIPVIAGEAGVGKSELAVAYAYAYAENFPQGRFLIPMQGVSTWTDALVKMVDLIKTHVTDDLESVGLPGDFDRLEREKKRDAAWRWLCDRSKQGELLLLLDNLEDLELISDDALRELTRGHGLPRNFRMIATTRLNEGASSTQDDRKFYELGRLSDKDAFEFFCLKGDNRFPFAKWPLTEEGEPFLKYVPPEKRPGPSECQKIKAEYAALKEIITLLGGHAWSLEIVSGFMVANESYSFEAKLADLEKDFGGNIIGRTHRGGKYQDPEKLLRPTVDRLLEFDEIEPALGEHILYLAEAASFFPPEQVPRDALIGIWKLKFGDKVISWDRGTRKAPAAALAVEQLTKYCIVNGEGDMLKMHRLTREFLRQEVKGDEEAFEILETMRQYLEEFLSATPDMTARQLQPWCGWAEDAIAHPQLRGEEIFLDTALDIVDGCIPVDLHDEAERLLLPTLEGARRIESPPLVGKCLFVLGEIHCALNRCQEAEREYGEALSIYRELAKKVPEKYLSYVANTLNNLANLHEDQNRYGEGEREYGEALSIYRELAEKVPEKYVSDVAMTLNNLGLLHWNRNHYAEAEREYVEALAIRRELAGEDPEKYLSDVAMTLDNLANLHEDQNRYDEGEREYGEALSICRELAEKIPEKYLPGVANTLNNLAILHNDQNRCEEAGREYGEALAIRRKLAEKVPEKYLPDVAMTLNNLGLLHENQNRNDEAEREFREALGIFRELAEKVPEKYLLYAALASNNLANLHHDQSRYEEAEREYGEALTIRRELAEKVPEKYLPDVAMTLYNLANLHGDRNRYDEAEREYGEALGIFRDLARKVPEKYLPGVANILNNLAILHNDQNRCEEAGREYGEALAIRRELAEKIPEKYLPDVAITLYNLALLHAPQGQGILNFLSFVFSPRARRQAVRAEAELAEAVEIARKFPDNPVCRKILENSDSKK